MIKRESKASIILRHWVFANAEKLNLKTCTFEVKQTETDSISFKSLEEHQENFNLAIKHGKKGVLIRNEAGTIGAPDYSYFKNTPAYIVVKFPSLICIIDIDAWEKEKIQSKRKSLTSSLAEKIATQTVKL